MQYFYVYGVVCFVAVFFFVNVASNKFAKNLINTAIFRLSIYVHFNFLMCLTCRIFEEAIIQGRGRGRWKRNLEICSFGRNFNYRLSFIDYVLMVLLCSLDLIYVFLIYLC